MSFVTKLGGLFASGAVHSWMGSLEFKVAAYDPTTDPALPEFHGPLICVFWHEYLLAPFYLCGHTKTAILTSRHRDAEWLSEAARHMGFDTIRGSTYQGGTRAMLEFIRDSGARNLGIACDGPRGPRRRLAQGPIYLSSKLQIPLVIYAFGFEQPWRMPTWDQFALPRPHSRARMITSPPIQIPDRLSRGELADCQQQVEQLLIRLTDEAESWAHSGARVRGERPMRRRPAHPDATYSDPRVVSLRADEALPRHRRSPRRAA